LPSTSPPSITHPPLHYALPICVAAKRRPAGEHLVQQDAEAEDVAAIIDLAAACLFRRHVRHGPEHHAGIGFLLQHRHAARIAAQDRKSTRLNSITVASRMTSSA